MRNFPDAEAAASKNLNGRRQGVACVWSVQTSNQKLLIATVRAIGPDNAQPAETLFPADSGRLKGWRPGVGFSPQMQQK